MICQIFQKTKKLIESNTYISYRYVLVHQKIIGNKPAPTLGSKTTKTKNKTGIKPSISDLKRLNQLK